MPSEIRLFKGCWKTIGWVISFISLGNSIYISYIDIYIVASCWPRGDFFSETAAYFWFSWAKLRMSFSDHKFHRTINTSLSFHLWVYEMDSSVSEFGQSIVANRGFSQNSSLANSVDRDGTARRDMPSHLDMHCLQRYLLVCRDERV